jgi:outer membrane immunogenic protein
VKRSFLLSAAVAVLAASAASRAAANPTASDEIWTGPYVGANIGGTWGDTFLHASLAQGGGAVVIPPGDITAAASGPYTTNSSTAGFAVGGEAGYNYQTGHLVIGIETDGGAFDIRQSRNHTFQSALLINPPVHFTIGQSVKTDWMWTLRPRLGYAWGPWLAYITGGLGVTDARISAAYSDTSATPHVASFTHSSTRAGGVFGVGGAWMFAPGWSGKLEWLYGDFGHVSGTIPVGNGYATFTSSGDVRANVVRTGIDYKF